MSLEVKALGEEAQKAYRSCWLSVVDGQPWSKMQKNVEYLCYSAGINTYTFDLADIIPLIRRHLLRTNALWDQAGLRAELQELREQIRKLEERVNSIVAA